MKMSLSLLVAIVSLSAAAFTSAFEEELKIKEGDQYFGKASYHNSESGLDEKQACAITFHQVDEAVQTVLGYKHNVLAVSVEFVSSQITGDFVLKNKTYRDGNRFYPVKDAYQGGERWSDPSEAAKTVELELDKKTKLPKRFLHREETPEGKKVLRCEL